MLRLRNRKTKTVTVTRNLVLELKYDTVNKKLKNVNALPGRAGEDLSGQDVIIFLIFLLTVSYFNSSTRFRVTLTVFVLRFRNRNISFLLHHQTDRLQCRSMWLACQCS